MPDMYYQLFCSRCNRPQTHMVLPWQTQDGHMGALSVICQSCSRLMVLELDKGWELKLMATKGLQT